MVIQFMRNRKEIQSLCLDARQSRGRSELCKEREKVDERWRRRKDDWGLKEKKGGFVVGQGTGANQDDKRLTHKELCPVAASGLNTAESLEATRRISTPLESCERALKR